MSGPEPDVLDRIVWRKSSFSAGNGGCVEVGWRKSSFSAGSGACVEVGPSATGVAVRDSKQVDSPLLSFPTPDWRSFLTSL
ncbi:DUF397 domain-containing protein [Actinokineospora sp. NBRC 105648]|uniref:DUF397 domain-containing protein n=1 Tax=Actinokineospora sp. NBRC 105648 TaxID=3032206 RepID=UPI0024A58573|nr:DUF397 domain-containing protein [Actinokineospora sp. NBRC 105648]GLZ37675.1 hypothetical protein Acsp05_13000 [Actinokineospora sp. NBRC 105648]